MFYSSTDSRLTGGRHIEQSCNIHSAFCACRHPIRVHVIVRPSHCSQYFGNVLTHHGSSAVSTVVLFSIAVVQLPVPSCPVEATADQPSASSSSPIPICRPRYTLLDIVVNLPMPFRIAAVVMMVVSLSYTAFNWYYFQKLVPFSAPSDIEANVQSFTGAQGPASDSEHACPTNADTPPVGDSQAPPSTT